jgi:hypothetical protein
LFILPSPLEAELREKIQDYSSLADRRLIRLAVHETINKVDYNKIVLKSQLYKNISKC